MTALSFEERIALLVDHEVRCVTMYLTAPGTKHRHLGLETLEERKLDSLDFHDLAVWSIEVALRAAFKAGKPASGNQ